MMTFEPDTIELHTEHLNELAKLIHETDLKNITLSGAEVRALFDFDAKAKDITNFDLHIQESFISGKVKGEPHYISPELLLSEPLKENTWFEYAPTAAILNYLRNRLGDDAVLNKLQLIYDDEFEYLSTGQAKSVIKRYLGLTLSSSERNDIYRLRKKIKGYRKLVQAFEDKLSANRDRIDPYVDHDPSSSIPSNDELIEITRRKLAFMCWECKSYKNFPEGEIINPPYHHGKPMTLNWNVSRPLEDIESGIQELQQAINDPSSVLTAVDTAERREGSGIPEGFPKLFCEVCNEYQEIDEELQKRLDAADHRIALPKHHSKEMTIVTVPPETITKMKQLSEKFNLLDEEREPGLYYTCKSCSLIVKAGDIDGDEFHSTSAPIHHNEKMSRVQIRDKKE